METQNQLEWIETQSTISFRYVRGDKGRRRKKSLGGDREEYRVLSTRGGDYNRSLECQGGHQSNERHEHRLSSLEDEKLQTFSVGGDDEAHQQLNYMDLNAPQSY